MDELYRGRLSLQEIWRLGCADEPLSDGDREHFVGLARSRFFTFRLGMEHARSGNDAGKRASLIAGFVTELASGPGLERAWRDSEFFRDPGAEDVEEALTERRDGAGDHARVH
ncbi:MAG: hypothetical protein CMQ24_12440 [Gammaproteobacteria bacterium]|nr:hypothetical protein [Gammaproteobacteria bacterium]